MQRRKSGKQQKAASHNFKRRGNQHSQTCHTCLPHMTYAALPSGPSKFLFFRDGAEEILTFIATAAHLVIAYRMAHLRLSPAQEMQDGALLPGLQAQLQFTNNAPFHIQCVQLCVQVRCIWSLDEPATCQSAHLQNRKKKKRKEKKRKEKKRKEKKRKEKKRKEKKRKEKTTPFGVNLMRSQVLYRAAQISAKHSYLAADKSPHA